MSPNLRALGPAMIFASAQQAAIDTFWRNIRTDALHDPAADKHREVGAYALRKQIPQPSWYT